MKKGREGKDDGASQRPKQGEPEGATAHPALNGKRLGHAFESQQSEWENRDQELRRVRQLLERLRNRCAELYDAAPVAYVTLDESGLIQDTNRRALAMLGMERSRLINRPFDRYLAKEDRPAFREHLRGLADRDQPAATELRLVLRGGRTLPIEIRGTREMEADQGRRMTLLVLLDITQRKAAQEAFRKQESRLQVVLKAAIEAIVTINEQGLIESFNPAAERIFDHAAAEVIGRNVKLLMPSPYREEHDDYLSHYLQTGERKIIGIGREVLGLRKDGTTFPIEVSVSEIWMAERRVFIAFMRDITRRKVGQEALRQGEAMLAWSQEIAHVGGYFTNLTGTGAEQWSVEIFRILGLDPAGSPLTMGEYITRCVHPDDRERVRETYQRVRSDQKRLDLEYRIVRPDGAVRNVHEILKPASGDQRAAAKFFGTLQDITERKSLEREILQISEREQRRIGQDLHDGLCQHLAGIEFRLMGLKQKLQSKSNPEAAVINQLAKLVRQGIDQTRNLAHGLSPVKLGEDGLMRALQELAASTKGFFALSCSFKCPAPVLIHDNVVATHLYRIAQEAVYNAIRHGKAKSIEIHLIMENDRVMLGVKDDGLGLPKGERRHNGFGLRVMHYRAGMVGGSLVVQRGRAGGTSVICSLRTGALTSDIGRSKTETAKTPPRAGPGPRLGR